MDNPQIDEKPFNAKKQPLSDFRSNFVPSLVRNESRFLDFGKRPSTR
jgi:hypothetical protein